MAIMKLYDYANNAVEVELPDKETKAIYVHVISGDETGIVNFTDGTHIYFDASDSRMIGYDDGSYTVEGDMINKWLTWKPSGKRTTAAYERQEWVWEEEE